MPLEDDSDRHDGSGSGSLTRPDPERSIRSERASAILMCIARAIGIAPAAFFAKTADSGEPTLAARYEAADLIAGVPAGTPLARCLDVLRREAGAIVRPDSETPKLSS